LFAKIIKENITGLGEEIFMEELPAQIASVAF
jgi:hypothetical protein